MFSFCKKLAAKFYPAAPDAAVGVRTDTLARLRANPDFLDVIDTLLSETFRFDDADVRIFDAPPLRVCVELDPYKAGTHNLGFTVLEHGEIQASLLMNLRTSHFSLTFPTHADPHTIAARAALLERALASLDLTTEISAPRPT